MMNTITEPSGLRRYLCGIPRADNGNYLWIQHFHSAPNKKGRVGFAPQENFSKLFQNN